MDKENTPPSERRGPRAITPPADNQRRLQQPEDVIDIGESCFDKPLHSFRTKWPLGNQVMLMIKQILNQVMLKLFEKGM